MMDNRTLEMFIVSRWLYRVGKQPILSDEEYNRLYAELKESYPDNKYVVNSWSDDECPVELLRKYGYDELIDDLTFTYTTESMSSLRTDEEVEAMFGNLAERTRVSFKIDGWNTQLSYYDGTLISANTRGRTGNNKDIDCIRHSAPSTINIKGRVKVIGESSIPFSEWDRFSDIYGVRDQRAAVSTVIANNVSRVLMFSAFNIIVEGKPIVEDKYALLKELGFNTPYSVMANNYATLKRVIQIMGNKKKNYDLLTDGLVVENSKVQVALRVGEWYEKSYSSIVTGYSTNYTPYGVSINITIQPTNVDGKVITELSVVNLANVIENNLRVGYPVAFALRSGANPVIDFTNTYKLQMAGGFM